MNFKAKRRQQNTQRHTTNKIVTPEQRFPEIDDEENLAREHGRSNENYWRAIVMFLLIFHFAGPFFRRYKQNFSNWVCFVRFCGFLFAPIFGSANSHIARQINIIRSELFFALSWLNGAKWIVPTEKCVYNLMAATKAASTERNKDYFLSHKEVMCVCV